MVLIKEKAKRQAKEQAENKLAPIRERQEILAKLQEDRSSRKQSHEQNAI